MLKNLSYAPKTYVYHGPRERAAGTFARIDLAVVSKCLVNSKRVSEVPKNRRPGKYKRNVHKSFLVFNKCSRYLSQ